MSWFAVFADHGMQVPRPGAGQASVLIYVPAPILPPPLRSTVTVKASKAAAAGPPRPLPGLRRDIMHPMFKELFIDTDADDLAAGQDRRRRVRGSRRVRPAMIVRPAARHRENRPLP